MITVYVQSVRETGPRDINGATSIAVGERESAVFEGSGPNAAEMLRTLPIGLSVAVRHAGGLRSCMNTPSLWDWTVELV